MKVWGLAVLVVALVLTACGGSREPSGTDLVVSGTGPAAPVQSGETATFTMSVANVGKNAASNVKIVNTVGNQLALTEITCTASGGATCPDAPSPVMTIASVPVGGTLVFEVNTTVAPTGGSTITITNTMSATVDDDVNRTDNAATAQGEAFSLSSSVVVTGLGPSGTVTGGGSAEFVMTVRNDGPDPASDLRIVNTVGSNLTLTAINCSASGGATCPSSVGPVMDVAELAIGGVLTFNVSTTVAIGTNGAITNTLSVTHSNDPDREDNTAVAVATAVAFNISVSATAPTGPVAGGAVATFTMVVTNSGPGTGADVAITNTVGANLTLGTLSCVAGGGALCPASLGATMVVPTLPPDGTLSFTVPTTVTAGANGTVTNVMTATAAGDSRPGDDSDSASVAVVSADLGVSQTGAATVNAGDTAVFTAVVSNPGPGPVTDLSINHTLSGGFAATIGCVPSPGATCPTVLGSTMTLASLPIGRWLTFTFEVPVSSAARGDIVSVVEVTADGDPDLSNNSASVTTVAVDARNGAYKVHAADGRQYDLTINFDAGQYTMSGNGLSVQRSFAEDGNGDFTVSGNARLRVAEDLVIGNHDFGGGALPFVAARRFATTVGELTGVYNLATRNVAANGAATTRAGTARVAGNDLQVCQTDAVVNPTQNCTAGELKTYALSVSGDVYTGVEVTTGEVYSFRLARTGASEVLLSAGTAPDSTLQLRIGLPDSSGLAGGTLRGATTDADWGVMTLTSTTYAFSGAATNASASLQRISNAGPFAMMFGLRTSDNATVYVLQASPLAVVVGGFGEAASGLLQIAVP